MDKEIMEQFQMLAGMMEKMSGQLNSRMDRMESRMDRMESRMDSMESRMATKDDLKASEARTKVYMENTITKRLDALVDGYKSVHEKQWELERDNEQLKAQVSDLQDRVARIENNIA